MPRRTGEVGGAVRVARNLDGAEVPLDRFPVSRTIAEEVARSGVAILLMRRRDLP